MNVEEESSILLVGLSGTGKTNYLVALDIILDDQDQPNGLKHSEFAADRAYLQPLREQWLRGEELEHTNRQIEPQPHHLLVIHPMTGTRASFHIPDLAGETFDSQFVTRSMSKDFEKRVRAAKGVILFLHCNHESGHAIHEDPSFMDTHSSAESSCNKDQSYNGASEWQLEEASSQVKLVDLLQFIDDVRTGGDELPIAVVISAWDLVESSQDSLREELPAEPFKFIEKRWPLLDQYLRCNHQMFPFRAFGISARGGGQSEDEIERLTSIAHPPDRILVVDGCHRSSDITRPVRWILRLLDETKER